MLKKYLQGTKVLDCKYENAIREILDLGFQSYEVETDLKKLGVMYKSLVQPMKDEKEKITNVIEHMELLSLAAPIRKLLMMKSLKPNVQSVSVKSRRLQKRSMDILN